MTSDGADPLISIIIPTYNREAFVGSAIASVLCQTYSNFECLLIDGGSTDHTLDILRCFDDDRILVVTRDRPLGLSNARNTGLSIATGDYILFLDDDDELYPNAISELYSALDSSSAQCVGAFSAGEVVRPNGEAQQWSVHDGTVEQVRNLDERGPSCVMIERRVFDEIGGFDESLPSKEDTDLWLRIFSRYSMIGIDEVLYRRNDHSEQMTKHSKIMLRGTRKILDKHHDSLESDLLADLYCNIGLYSADLGRFPEARSNIAKAVQYKPAKKEYYATYLFLLFNRPGYQLGQYLYDLVYSSSID